jgi:hypothetical protein
VYVSKSAHTHTLVPPYYPHTSARVCVKVNTHTYTRVAYYPTILYIGWVHRVAHVTMNELLHSFILLSAYYRHVCVLKSTHTHTYTRAAYYPTIHLSARVCVKVNTYTRVPPTSYYPRTIGTCVCQSQHTHVPPTILVMTRTAQKTMRPKNSSIVVYSCVCFFRREADKWEVN